MQRGEPGPATFAALTSTMWTYEFTSFTAGQFFQFNWDPDIAADGNYGAVVAEQMGLRVRIRTTAGEFTGTLGPGGPEGGLRASIASSAIPPAPIPEPGTLVLFGTAGLAGAVRARRRRRQSRAR